MKPTSIGMLVTGLACGVALVSRMQPVQDAMYGDDFPGLLVNDGVPETPTATEMWPELYGRELAMHGDSLLGYTPPTEYE